MPGGKALPYHSSNRLSYIPPLVNSKRQFLAAAATSDGHNGVEGDSPSVAPRHAVYKQLQSGTIRTCRKRARDRARRLRKLRWEWRLLIGACCIPLLVGLLLLLLPLATIVLR